MSWGGQFSDFRPSPQKGHSRANLPSESATVGEAQDSVIAKLSPGIWTSPIIGVIIGKGEARCVPSKKDPNNDRYVISFTLRDSTDDLINVNCWGGEQYSAEIANNYHIGDVVEISQAAVQTKPLDGSDEKFRPATPGPYQLSLSETKSTVQHYTGWGTERYTELLHIPTKPSNDFYTLADVMTNGQSLHGEYINIMAAVRSVGSAKNITTKTGRHIKRCEVKLFDDTISSFAFVMWDEELITMAQVWQPKDNVLFVADVRVTFDDFRKSMIGTASARTIVTVNPDSPEAYNLYQYAQTAPLYQLDGPAAGNGGNDVDLSSIQDVYTVSSIKDKVGSLDSGALYGILYAAVTSLNLDSEPGRATTTKCGKCKRRLDGASRRCVNMECPIGSNPSHVTTPADTEVSFSLQMALSDHTGSLQSCSLQGDAASTMLACSVEEYIALGEDMRTELKWNFLLERCMVYFKLLPSTSDWPQPRMVILSCERADPKQASKSLH